MDIGCRDVVGGHICPPYEGAQIIEYSVGDGL